MRPVNNVNDNNVNKWDCKVLSTLPLKDWKLVQWIIVS